MIAVNPDRTRCPYEVGDILQTINSTDPARRWPGTQWKQITDRFIRGADAQHPAGSTGGSWTHTLTKNELPNVNLLWRYEDNPGHYLPHGVTWPNASDLLPRRRPNCTPMISLCWTRSSSITTNRRLRRSAAVSKRWLKPTR